MPGFNPFRRHDFKREQVVAGYDPVTDGFAYPQAPTNNLAPDPSCTCTVLPPSSLLVETDTERAYTASRVALCDTCYDRLLASPLL